MNNNTVEKKRQEVLDTIIKGRMYDIYDVIIRVKKPNEVMFRNRGRYQAKHKTPYWVGFSPMACYQDRDVTLTVPTHELGIKTICVPVDDEFMVPPII